ncbi:MAG: DUF6485 family protein [Actinomycetota bacterium]
MNCDIDKNSAQCTCTYPGCSRRGKCCACLTYHKRRGEIPACFFPPEIEATYDRSIARFISCHSSR